MQHYHLGIWSSDYLQLTGQAQVTARAAHLFVPLGAREYIYSGNTLRMLINWLGASSRLIWDVALGRVRTLYMVPSRSNGGFLRDLPALLVTFLRVRVIAHIHGSDIINLLTRRLVSPLALQLYRRCDVIVPSDHLRAGLETLLGHSPWVCENFHHDLSGRGPDVAPNRQPEHTFQVYWNSNVMSSKGFFDVVDAVRLLADEGLSIRLIAIGRPIGDAEMSADVATRRLRELQTNEWFDYRGPLSPIAAHSLLHSSNVVCLPSRYPSECQPLALIQAMCAGKQIIVSDTAALRSTVGSYPAIFVPSGCPNAIAGELKALAGRRPKYGSEESLCSWSEAAKLRFSPERFDKELFAIVVGRPRMPDNAPNGARP